MAGYDTNAPYKTLTTAKANYTISQWGNTLEWTYETEVNFVSNADETTFYNYVFTLSSI